MIDLTLEGFDILEDLWGKISGVKLFFAGNQWFVLPDLIPFLKSKGYNVFIETLPPGVVRRQLLGEEVKIGNLIIDFKPDIVSLPPSMLEGIRYIDTFEYVSNDLVIIFNKEEFKDWCGLKGKKVAIPNPETEGIGQLFKSLYKENCGNYSDLVSSNPVYLTKVHHREIPKMMLEGKIDAGVVWKTEALYWKFYYTEPVVNKVGKLSLALLNNEAKSIFELFKTDEIRSIYEKYGFKWLV